MTKTIWQSRTFWLAVLQALAGAIVVFQTSYPQVGWLMMAKSIVDVLIRIDTTTEVAITQ